MSPSIKIVGLKTELCVKYVLTKLINYKTITLQKN